MEDIANASHGFTNSRQIAQVGLHKIHFIFDASQIDEPTGRKVVKNPDRLPFADQAMN